MHEFAISRRRLYILPTRIGWYFALILIALFAIAIKFNNQPAFMMLFLLTSAGLVAMLYTHNNVIGLKLSSKATAPAFVGQQVVFPIIISNPSKLERRGLWLLCDSFQSDFRIDQNQQHHCDIKLSANERGYFTCPEIFLSSQFPVGLFFCWSKRFQPEQACLVYPQPISFHDLPPSRDGEGHHQTQHSSRSQGQDYSGMKPYQPGDRLRDLHWPSLAKSNKAVTIEYQDHSGDAITLAWQDLPNTLSGEEKLSQLCYWVLQAEQDGLRYQLKLPNQNTKFDRGDTHMHDCLKRLALWDKPEGKSA